ncbi:MAG: hypothetical protein B7Z35_04745 [Hydrogenophilales bacterium 12-61-10]|nr:MAG: hypothetical protein B7Z35_04745 [Hydrogenophilales bacterium 12-61-10]OYX29210.1 MAG: hypothetical protein B7Z03_09640 [Hydrogenophilales bacterium 32-62-9]
MIRPRTLLLADLLLVCGLSLSPAAAFAEAIASSQCGPGPGGATCDGNGPASQGNTSETNQGAGNPINVITGNKYQREVDLPALPGVLGLEIVRHYNSAYSGTTAISGILGRGWKLSYETDLYAIGNTLQIVEADGTRIIFVRDPNNPSQCATNDPTRGTVAIHKTARGDEYVWTWTNGRVLSFNPRGKLTQIKAPTGEFVSLARDPAGALMKVTDPQGRSLELGYPARSQARFNGVTHIDSPVGRFSYAYGSVAPKDSTDHPRGLLANLAAVTFPNTVSRRYHYEDATRPTLLTGISVESNGANNTRVMTRLNTWAYDTNGRGILSVKGWPKRLDNNGRPVPGTGIEQVNLDFSQRDKTILTNSLGQKTTYTHAIIGNEYRLLEVKGAGCASCGEANVRYGYDALGRLTTETKLGADGRPLATTRTERDALGRVVEVRAIAYANGKPLPAKLLAHYEYAGDTSEPVLIARPSVVAGEEHQIRFTYNAEGQPLSVTETGFAPALPSIAGSGTGSVATPISRTTTYAYRTVNDRSVLSQIDGPLANGPKGDPADSDVTRVEWDGRGGAVIALTQPGAGINRIEYDAAGRIAEVRNADGFSTRFTYAARGQLLRVASSGARWAQAGIKPDVQSYRYDAQGNQIETRSGEADRPQTRQAFDAAGRLLWQAEALGILKRASYDTEGHLLSSAVQTRSFEQTERYRYDDRNRLIQVSDNTGVVRNVVYAKNRTAQPRITSAFHVLKDDFGREVMVASASHGTLVKRYNAIGQLIEQRTSQGDTQTYAYDLTGQRIRHNVIPKTGATQTTTWRYAQGRLAEVIDPVQTERIRYNERGQPASKTVTLKLASGAEATHATRYTYTADGSLASQSLPDGSKILYERNGQGQVVAVSRQTSPWIFFGWGNPPLVKDLQRDLIGLRHVTYGNGIEGEWQRSREGVLARVVYTRSNAGAATPTNLASTLDQLVQPAHAQPTPPAPAKLPGALGLPANPYALFDARLLYDDAGDVLLQQQRGHGIQRTQAYSYDSQSQLIAAQSASPSVTVKTTAMANTPRAWRYHYDRNGNRVLAQENVPVAELRHTRKASYDRTSNALTAPPLQRETAWNAQGQLISTRQPHRELARYGYNHHGLRVSKQTATEAAHTLYNDQRQRIADLDADGRITRQYLWLGDHLIATLDARQPKALQAPTDGIWQELAQTARALWTNLTGNEDRLVFVHVNHLGAPVAATNEAGDTIWQADYAPYGQVIKVSAVHPERNDGQRTAYSLALRLPGQWEDEESGLYYNDARYYDPYAGRYLSPDPLGRLAERLGSPNAYSYVNNNPASYIDPWGLILFAFDGTNNSNPPPGVDDFSNVYKFYQAYDATQDGPKWYMNGVGRPDPDSGTGTGWLYNATLDAGNGYTARDRVTYMLEQLDNYMQKTPFQKGAAVGIDIVGFSRGAAMARDFANKVAQRLHQNAYKNSGVCVSLRFLGLWDTVAQFGANGAGNGLWQLAIPPEVKYVFQAVALNEHRYLFPGEDIGLGVQRGFIGSHADIGGSYGTGDISDVALNWIYDQAKSSGVKMLNWGQGQTDIEWARVTNPVLHDKSNGTEDRDRCLRANNEVWANHCQKQKVATPGGMNWAQSAMFRYSYLNPQLDADGVSKITGYVNMEGYAKWLKQNYGFDIAYQ